MSKVTEPNAVLSGSSECLKEEELRGTVRSSDGHVKALMDHEAGFAPQGGR